MSQRQSNTKILAIQNVPFHAPISLTRSPETSQMGVAFSKSVGDLGNSEREFESDGAKFKSSPSVENTTIGSLNKSNTFQTNTAEADILNIREPICPGNKV